MQTDVHLAILIGRHEKTTLPVEEIKDAPQNAEPQKVNDNKGKEANHENKKQGGDLFNEGNNGEQPY